MSLGFEQTDNRLFEKGAKVPVLEDHHEAEAAVLGPSNIIIVICCRGLILKLSLVVFVA